MSLGAAQPLDPAVCELLKVPPECCFVQPYGKGFSRPGKYFSTPAKVTVQVNGEVAHCFMKSGPDGDMFESKLQNPPEAHQYFKNHSRLWFCLGEHAALRALHSTVPSICPYALGHGKFANSPNHFLLMEYLDVFAGSTTSDNTRTSPSSGLSLEQKLAKLHTTPAPSPPGHSQPMFGWPTSTYCGSTRQDNSFRASWSEFYAENRLLAVLQLIEERHGADPELRKSVEAAVDKVVPRLLRNGHLGGKAGVVPVLVHGDLWHGNRARGYIASWAGGGGSGGGQEEMVFDPSACYAHSEYELGIMRGFGGFSAGFFNEYHRLVPKTEPQEEYEDRITLYEL